MAESRPAVNLDLWRLARWRGPGCSAASEPGVMPLERTRPVKETLIRRYQRGSMMNRRREDDPIGRVAMQALELRRSNADLADDGTFNQTARQQIPAPLPQRLGQLHAILQSSKAISQKLMADAASAPSASALSANRSAVLPREGSSRSSQSSAWVSSRISD